MANRIPNYLRLHTDDERKSVVAVPEQDVFSLDLLCQKFSQVTGADLQYGTVKSLPRELDWFMEIEDSRPGRKMAFGIKTAAHQEPPLQNRQQIESLAGEIGWLANKLHRTERALWEREAELAVGIPVTARPETECEQIAERLESILRCGVDAVGCSAGALYLLDEATTELKLRSNWGFENSAFTEPARALRGARADLEALTGHAVVVESRDELNFWNIPAEFSAAVCIPVSSMTMPLGTLWIYSEQPRPFTDIETNLIEIIAGRIAVELEREVLVREAANRRHGDALAGAIAWQQQMIPTQPPLADGWDFAASTSYQDSLTGDHCFWNSRGDGRVLATISSILGDVPEIALTASLLAGTVRGLCESRLVADVVAGVNRTLWSSSDGDLLASIFASEIDPRTGQVNYVATGDIGVFIIRPHGWEQRKVRPEYCGSDEDLPFPTMELQLNADDMLLVFSSPRGLSPRLVSNDNQMQQMAEVALHHTHLASAPLIDLLRRQWEPRDPLHQTPPAMLVVKRSG
jgi:hypothetical protein